MSIVILLIRLYSLVNSCSAIPLTNSTVESDDFISLANITHQASKDVLQDIYSQRSVWDILWSCLATTFAVTWLSIHPNIPAPDEEDLKVTLHRLKLGFWALVAPEFVVFWAWRQHRGAHRIAEEIRRLAKERNQKHGHDWKSTHGHFLQMGGFTIQTDDEPPRVLYLEHFELMVGEIIDIPPISAKEIKDRGKSDPLGQLFATLQILWFITQAVVRWLHHLDITQLELTTAALACVNVTMYILWWNKPLDVRYPITIRPRPLKPYDQPVQALDHPNPWISYDKISIQEVSDAGYEILMQESDDSLSTAAPEVSQHYPFLEILESALFKVFIRPINPFFRLVNGVYSERNCSREKRTPIFYVWTGGEKVSITSGAKELPYPLIENPHSWRDNVWRDLTGLLGAFFGYLHYAGWNLEFPSPTEKTIWQICTYVISVGPGLFGYFRLTHDQKWRAVNIYLVAFVSYCLLFARIILFIDSLLALLTFSPSAFATVD